MASWMVHLRVADKLLNQIPNLSPEEFIVGNIAPDSGVPNEDWSSFTPNTTVSHFRAPGKKADHEAFAAKYFTPEQQAKYNAPQFSFYLGYLTHLITDFLWARDIFAPLKVKFPEQMTESKKQFIWKVKEDWYDLDFKYLRDHPDFRAFSVYLGASGFVNEFMEEFTPDAFDNRRAYITGWYLAGKDNLDRAYPYLSEAEMDAFVDACTKEVLDILHIKYGILL